MTALLRTESLFKRYGDVTAVDGVDLEVAEGECFGLLGPNGAGKTTTIEMIEGITPPTSGRVLYRGEPAGTRFREEAGIAFQNTALQDFISVGETLQMFRDLYASDIDLAELIDDCALEALLDRDNRKLSGGQRQRLLLAIALINRPRIVFLDEPTTGLDPQSRRNFWQLVQRVKARGTSIVLTTHYMEEAHLLCDRIAIMDQGRIIADGAPDTLLRAQYDDVIVRMPVAALPAQFTGERIDDTDGDQCEIHTSDVPGLLRELLSLEADLDALTIRQRNLEDLFIDLTGRALRA